MNFLITQKQTKIILHLTLCVLISFSLSAQEKNDERQVELMRKFVGAVNVKKKNKVYRMIADEYKEKIDKSKKETLAFFFAGNLVEKNLFSTVSFSKIYSMRIVEYFEMQNNVTMYHVILSTEQGTIETQLYVKTSGKKDKLSIYPVHT